ncbi:winged helix-turn-helix transcriptional regulator [Actinophytocola sp. NPDC049390]|uniref:winged helix-turn-helix transcriptional regulator n=1 Tax=Actinophytocola sp. NPDC049390 TaxID=3363894 RepID=UPI0037918C8A
MATTRRYHDGCAIATALDHVGERWSMLIVRELLLGPKRFTDLQEGLPGAGPKILAQRLRELEDTGILRRRTLAPPASSQVYELTEWGARLEDVIVALGRWGAESPEPSDEHVGADSAMLKLRSFFRPDESWTATYEVRLGRNRFTVRVTDGELTDVRRGEPTTPDATVDTDSDTLDDVIGDAQALATAIDSGRLTVTGDEHAARRLFTATRL